MSEHTIVSHRSGQDRNDANALTHTYVMTEGDRLGLYPMCGYGWNRSNGTRFSVFRGTEGSYGKCKLCLKNIQAGKPPVKDGFPHKTRWL